MFGLENRGETLIFMSRHFNETMIIDIVFSGCGTWTLCDAIKTYNKHHCLILYGLCVRW